MSKFKTFEAMLKNEDELNQSILLMFGHDGADNAKEVKQEADLDESVEEVQKRIDELVAKGKLVKYEAHEPFDLFPEAYYGIQDGLTPSNY